MSPNTWPVIKCVSDQLLSVFQTSAFLLDSCCFVLHDWFSLLASSVHTQSKSAFRSYLFVPLCIISWRKKKHTKCHGLELGHIWLSWYNKYHYRQYHFVSFYSHVLKKYFNGLLRISCALVVDLDVNCFFFFVFFFPLITQP